MDYTVGGINQTDVNSNAATFVVDRRINLTVAEVGGAATQVGPGSTNQVTTFTVTTTTNGTQDFRLVASQDAGGATAFGDTDTFDAINVRVFVESGTTAGFQAAEDTATFIDDSLRKVWRARKRCSLAGSLKVEKPITQGVCRICTTELPRNLRCRNC